MFGQSENGEMAAVVDVYLYISDLDSVQCSFAGLAHPGIFRSGHPHACQGRSSQKIRDKIGQVKVMNDGILA